MKINVVQEAKFKALPVVELDEYDDDDEEEMIEYRVCFQRTISLTQYASTTITARNEDEAQEIAQESLDYDPDSFDWEDGESRFDACDEEIDYVEEY